MFLEKNELKITNEFLINGYIIITIENKEALKKITAIIKDLASQKLNFTKKQNLENFFNETHKFIDNKDLNDFRLFIYNSINNHQDFRKYYYQLAKILFIYFSW